MPQCNEPIAIIGTGCRFPGDSGTPSKLWKLLQEPRDLLETIPTSRFNAEAFYHPDPTHHGTTDVRKSYFLSEDPSQFDAKFFGIQPMEAESIDPQQRMLLETVYESLCAAGLRIEDLRGSPTAVYVGLMCDDWSGILSHDWDAFPTYSATGMARSIISNRVSYFFDWHGPSMTIDTACSSSLVAVHQAVQALRSGESKVAVAAGANLILSPGMYIAESKLHMLSPDGRSRMWDENANGYARGEGIASVILKTLSQAVKDGDHIECVIRETGLNQDGRTAGITVPSNVAQTVLIKQTYERAGLDINNPIDRPQYFHAHGTGTAVGDPKEAQAISEAFPVLDIDSSPGNKLYVGSIKTIIGHTEGTAGLASLIGTSLALQNGVIPPNMHFNQLSSKVAPFYKGLEILTKAHTWPAVAHGQCRRASVNSFGFGGSNAHAIIESYETPKKHVDALPLVTPLTFSATTEKALLEILDSYAKFLKENESTNLRNLAWTLQTRRSTFPLKMAISGTIATEISAKIDSELAQVKEKNGNLGIRSSNRENPRVLGIFTGQGAQWPAMGRELILISPHVREIISMLDLSLAELPSDHRPSWSIKDELITDTFPSRLTDASLAQPLCTAIQIILVDLLRAAGITLHAVVGHSSGEIGAAYAAGYLQARDAIRIAYYRGFYANLARSPEGKVGAMLAVGTSFEDASEFCALPAFEGRLIVAASNSSSSVTLSGDEDAVNDAIEIFRDEQKFCRKLKVDTAYHSFHMDPCTELYLQAMERCRIEIREGTTAWFSSVVPGQLMTKGLLTEDYWVDNMSHPVMFANAIRQAVSDHGPFDIALEIGPHPALKGPCLNIIEETSGEGQLPYTGLLSRGNNDVETFSSALGYMWTHLGSVVDFDNYDKLVSSSNKPKEVVQNLPSYPWDHQKTYWTESRKSGAYRIKEEPPHPILGTKLVEGTTSEEIQWRNLLSPKEVPWLNGHKLQGQTIFPATGYAVMAVEAAKTIIGNQEIKLIEIEDLSINRAISFNEDAFGVELLFSLRVSSPRSDGSEPIVADFWCYSVLQQENSTSMNATGRVLIYLGDVSVDVLPSVPSPKFNMVDVEIDRFYASLSNAGYNYSKPFRGITDIKRKMDSAAGILVNQAGVGWENAMMVHPGLLDTALQTIFAAFCSPGDERLWSLHVPTKVHRISINPYFCASGTRHLPYQAAVVSGYDANIRGDVEVFSEDGRNGFIQIEGVSLVPFSPASPANDAVLFSKFVYSVANPDGELAARSERSSPQEMKMAYDLERVSYYYLRHLSETITPEEKEQTLLHYKRLLNWADHVVKLVASGKHPFVKPGRETDSHDQIVEILNQYRQRVDVRLIEVVGENLPTVIRDKTNILEYMTQDGLLSNFYEEGLGLISANRWIARMARQIAHRYPHMHILEIGAGTGGATRAILKKLGPAFSSYTYTDISSAFFERAEERFKDYAERMVFQTLDMEKDITAQGFIAGSYDMIIASNVLHATNFLEQTMKNVRQLLKPGGYLLSLEVVNNDPLRNGLPMGGLPGWWIGADNGRPWGPTLTLLQWDNLLRKTGFSGIETATPDYDELHPFSVHATQALDDRVRLLRKPLSVSSAESLWDDLVIIGGKTLQISQLVEDMMDLLSRRYQNIHRIDSIGELQTFTLPESATVLCVTELDEQLLEFVTAAKLESLKSLFSRARNILWVTSASRDFQSHAYQMIGIARAMRFEYPNINLQMVDVDCVDEAHSRLFAETLIRLQTVDAWNKAMEQEPIMWSIEPEIFIEGKRHIIPRLYPNRDQNARYNSSRRVITRNVSLETTTVGVVGSGSSYTLQEKSPFIQQDSAGKTVIRVSHSLLESVKVHSTGYFCLCIGSVIDTGDSVIALSCSNDSVVHVPQECTVLYNKPSDPSNILLSVAASLLADDIVSVTPTNGVLLVHDPADFMIPSLVKQADGKNIMLYFTTSEKNKGVNWIYIHPTSPKRLIKRAIPMAVSFFMDLSLQNTVDGLGSRIAECLPSQCKLRETILSKKGPEVHSGVSFTQVGDLLRAAWKQSYTEDFKVEASQKSEVVLLQDVSLGRRLDKQVSVVDWTASPTVPVKLQPVDSQDLFHRDKTYFMVGLSGEVGQSLCEWMVCHGARYVVLTSRNPKANIDPEWIASLEAVGATIKVMSLDITKKETLRSCYNEICRTLPPIAGVANGAMILQDTLFHNMDFEAMDKVLKPKVDGTKYLDELFSGTPLDFFILFSSITSVLGNSGQSNYIAANMFMTSFAFQRKKRGLAGSVIDISSLVGIGYVERSETFDAEYFNKMGYTNISEQDLHQMFAEAILVGKPDSKESAEIVTGFAPTYADAEIRAQYRSDLKFCHFILRRPREKQSANQTASIPVKVQLLDAKTKEQVYEILKESFTVRLKKILQLSTHDGLNENVSLVEQGVDSLVAVEARSWFLKELDIDMPVLKILGGASVMGLLEDAVGRLPDNLVSHLGSSAFSKSVPVVPAIPELVAKEDRPRLARFTSEVTTATALSSVSCDGTPPKEDDTGSDTSFSLLDAESSESISVHPPEITEKMSFGQSRFWFLNHFLKDKTTFNMAFSVRLEGPLRAADLARAVRLTSEKHEALRTRFISTGNHLEQPIQGILSSSLVDLKTKPIISTSQALQELDDMRAHVWNLEHWESMKVLLLKLSDTTHYLIVGCHHIAMDGLSFQIFFADLEKAYLNQPLSPCTPECQYRAFSAQQHKEYESGGMDADLEFYRGIIPVEPKALPLFPFTSTKCRKTLESYGTHRMDFRLDPTLTARIKERSRKNKATTFHFYLAALQTLLFRLLDETDEFFIGIADANRIDRKFMGTLGFFLNLLPLRFRRGPSTRTFNEAITETRNIAYAALAHSKLPFDVLLGRLNIGRSATHTPLFQVFVDYRQGVQERTNFAECSAQGESWHIAKTGYDLSLDIIENAAGDSLLTLKLQESLYSESDTRMLLQSYVNLLTSFAMDSDALLESPSLWQPEDFDKTIEVGRGPIMELQWESTLSHRIDAMAEEHGSDIALKDGTGNVLTYSQMAERVEAIAYTLEKTDITYSVNNNRIAVFQEPTTDWVCSMLAIFRVGATYVPFDLRSSLPRLVTIFNTCKPAIIIAHDATFAKVPELVGLDKMRVINVSTLSTSSPGLVPNCANASSPAIILFTSGSTGTPKGVIYNHSSLRNQMEAYSREWNIAAGASMVLQQSAFSFDFSLDQIFAALCNGGSLYIVPASKRGDPTEITKLMASERVTYTSATPSEYATWIRYATPNLNLCSRWKYAFAGGENLGDALVEEFRKLDLPVRLFNNYGPCEITIASTKIEVPYKTRTPNEPIPAGFMLPNYSVYIVDKNLKLLPIGLPGEIVIGGAGVSAGYLDKELTRQKFVPDLFSISNSTYKDNGWNTMYRTGDRGRVREDGALFCEGRIEGDTQIKLRGFRIELEEIEKAIIEVANGVLIHAVVSVRGEIHSQFLAAHVVFARNYVLDSIDRENYLRNMLLQLPLPQYMCPTVVVPLDDLPLTKHLKIDRQAIKALPLPAHNETTTAELTESQSRLKSLWQEILPHSPAIWGDTDFFMIGGNSLLLVKLQAMIRETFDTVIRLVDLMNAGSLADMAATVQDAVRTTHVIDWSKETAVSDPLLKGNRELAITVPKKSSKFIILLTGATGYLGRHILPRLLADPRVAEVYCVAIREKDTPFKQRITIHSSKLVLRKGDLSLPWLGLNSAEFSTLSGKVDVILHSGANRSLWDSYEALRGSNLAPVKELVKLAIPKKIPIHFMSSGGVHRYSSTIPPTNGSDGYVASKWAAERYLSNVAEKLGVPVFIHRPVAANDVSLTIPTCVLDELQEIAIKMQTRPVFEGVQGHIDILPTETVVQDIFSAMFEVESSQVKLHKSRIRVTIGMIVDRIAASEDVRKLKTMPAVQWVGEAKKMGFSYFITAQDIVMGKPDREGLVSKR